MSTWSEEPRNLRVVNIGPASGEVPLGTVDGPGLYLFVGANTAGKTTYLDLLSSLHRSVAPERLLHVVNHGARRAELELQPCRLVFQAGHGGGAAELVEATGQDEIPPVAPMPDSIQGLIDGGGRKDPEARARHRLASLLEYRPVESTAERRGVLFGALDGHPWEVNPEAEGCAWSDLLEAAKCRTKRPCMTRDDIVASVMADPKRKGSILDDHAVLVARLNEIALSGERCLDVLATQMAAAEERLQGVARRAIAKGLFESEQLALQGLVDASTDSEGAEGKRAAAVAEASEARAARAAGLAAEARREELRAERGERPATDETAAALEAAVEAANRSRGLVAQLRETALRRSAEQQAASKILEAACARAREAWGGLASDVEMFLGSSEEAGRVGRASALSNGLGIVADLLVAVERARCDVQEVEGASGEAEAAHYEASARAESDESQERLARNAHANQLQARERWDAVTETLERPLQYPDEAEVVLLEEASSQAQGDVDRARLATEFVQAAAESESLIGRHARIEAAAKSYRQAARDSWSALGDVLTGDLAIPWLQVDGLEIYVGQDAGGRLLEGGEAERVVEGATESAIAEVSGDANLAPAVRGRRVRRRVREQTAGRISWKPLDSTIQLSTGELHEACLSLMLTRRDHLGGIVVLPWVVVAALDDARLGALAERFRAADLVAFSERPRRRGDPENLHLEKVQPVAAT